MCSSLIALTIAVCAHHNLSTQSKCVIEVTALNPKTSTQVINFRNAFMFLDDALINESANPNGTSYTQLKKIQQIYLCKLKGEKKPDYCWEKIMSEKKGK